MRWWALAAGVVAALFLVLPASASHHRATAGDVTMSVSRAGAKLTLNYTVTPPQCPNQQCYVNYGKPYQINIFITGISIPGPRGISVPEHCSIGGSPLVFCSSARNTDDPAATLPLSASVTVRVGTRDGATARIRVDGYSLGAEKSGIPVPIYDCSGVKAIYETNKAVYETALEAFDARVDEFLDSHTGIGLLALMLRSGFHSAQAHDEMKASIEQDRKALATYRKAMVDSDEELDACLNGEGEAGGRTRAAECSDAEWNGLLLGDKLKLKKVVPLVRKILAERKAHKRQRAARDTKRLKRQLAAEAKNVRRYLKALRACE